MIFRDDDGAFEEDKNKEKADNKALTGNIVKSAVGNILGLTLHNIRQIQIMQTKPGNKIPNS